MDATLGNPLSVDQLRLWRLFADCPTQSFRSYGLVRVRASLDPGALRRAFDAVASGQSLLRSRLVSSPGMLYPVLKDCDGSGFSFHDLGVLEGPEDREIERIGHELAVCRFSCGEKWHEGEPQLIRVCFGRSKDGAVLWGMAAPAFLIDGPSIDLLLRRVTEFALSVADYAADRRGQPALSYDAVSQWRERILAAPEAASGRRFWRERLSAHREAAPVTLVTASAESRERGTERTGIQRVTIGVQRESIPAFARTDRSAALSCFLAAWYLLLWRVRDRSERDLDLGVQFDGRTMQGMAATIGPLARFLPVSASIEPGLSFRDLCHRVARSLSEAAEWQDCFAPEDLGDIEDAAKPASPFDFGFELIFRDGGGDAQLEVVRRFSQLERFRLKLDLLYRDAADCEATLHYEPRELSPWQAQTLLESFCYCLRQVAANESLRLRDVQWQQGDPARAAVPAAMVPEYVPDRLRRIASHYPDRVALASDGQALSYARMVASADALAQRLQNRSLPPESCIAVAGDPSFNVIVGMIAVWMAGHHFVYVDPQHPWERSAHVLRESGVRLVLRDEAALCTRDQKAYQGPGVEGLTVIDIGVPLHAVVTQQRNTAKSGIHPQQLAYVSYTSGSTGDPNGVMISHGSIAAQMQWLIDEFGFRGDDTFLLKTPMGFDASIWEWIAPLFVGGKLVIAGAQMHLQPKLVASSIHNHRVTALQVVPTLLRLLMSDAEPHELRSLRYLFAGGEYLPPDVCSTFGQRFSVQIVNLYGPTETTINATWWSCPREAANLEATSIGAPVQGMAAHVLDPLGQPLPRDFIGELHLSGVGLARGYVRKAALTAGKFVPSPWGEGQRMYRTGDLVSYDASGKLLYWGRADNQIKLRGYRVELGEIESLLARHENVKTAVACVCELGTAGAPTLIAYAVPNDHRQRPGATELREYLRTRVPDYMMPALIVMLDHLPLRPTGKVDRKVLASREFVNVHSTDLYVAPQTPLQKALCEIWQHLLDVEAVGIDDDFLKLGGQSLLVTRLVGHIQQRLQVDVSPRLLFDFPVMRDFAAQVELRLSGRDVPGQMPGVAAHAHGEQRDS